MLMVKPTLAYMDVIRLVKDAFPELPMAAYNVSGEYSMIKATDANGWINETKVTLETLTSIKRADTDELNRFSDLVNELRDTPLHTAMYHPTKETLALFILLVKHTLRRNIPLFSQSLQVFVSKFAKTFSSPCQCPKLPSIYYTRNS